MNLEQHIAINQARESKQHTLQIDKQMISRPQSELSLVKHLNIGIKLSLVKKIYDTKKLSEKKNILLDWPNEKLDAILIKCQLVLLKNNNYYLGETANNVIHGKGIVIYSIDRFYEGEFQNNYKHGQGIESLPTGVYVGGYVNNKPEGRGVFESKQGDRYQGEFRAGMKHGKGKWISAKHSYLGEWRGNKPNGVGKIMSIQSQYEGTVVDGLKHGQGKQVFKNGDVYSGQYYNGRPQGHGIYIWNSSGSIYKGYFKNGLRHGKGIWTQNGDRYEGQFSNDKKNGYGHFVWASGNQYQGIFFEDIMHGQGCMKWTDGSWYKGNWLYGVQNGYGQILQVGQSLKKGIFENNCLVLQQDFSAQAVSKRLKLQRLNPRKQKQLIKNQAHSQSIKNKYIHQLQQFQTQSQYSKKILPSHNSSLLFRQSKYNLRNRIKSLKKDDQTKSITIEHNRPNIRIDKKRAKSFSDGQDVRLIDWRRMKALKPL